jgi:hypothetical protein
MRVDYIRTSQLNGCAYCLDMHNGWNRLAVGLRSPVGHYVSPHAKADRPAA